MNEKLTMMDFFLMCQARMEADWNTIDGEYGPTPGGLEAAIAAGACPEISLLRDIIKTAERNSIDVVGK